MNQKPTRSHIHLFQNNGNYCFDTDVHVNKFCGCVVTVLFFFIDSFIQKTKQRYNNTRTLTSRLNLSEMSEDLHNNPPFEISLTELGPDNNKEIKTYKTGGIWDM